MNKEVGERADKLYTDVWFLLKGETQGVKDVVMKMLGYRLISPEKLINRTLEWAGDQCPHTDREEPPMNRMDCSKCYQEFLAHTIEELKG